MPSPNEQEPTVTATSTSGAEITRLLSAWRGGDEAALDALVPLVYPQLRELARSCFRRERGLRTLQPTALVHEVYLRLVDVEVDWRSRAHFFAVAGRLMRRLLVDEARRRRRLKRGGERPLPIEELEVEPTLEGADPEHRLLDLDRALDRLERFDERKARVVEARLFAGLTIRETSEVLGIASATIERELKMARAWLGRELRSEPSAQGSSADGEP